MNKLHKIFSIVLTAAVAVSLLVVSGVSPVSADNNLWSQVVTPSATNQVMANNITSSGHLAKAANGDLYTYVQTTSTAVPPVVTNNLARSTNGGRTWTYVAAPGVISYIFCSKSEANVVYFSVGATLYKSIDNGATWANRGSTPDLSNITAIAAALAGGSYKVVLGTTDNVFFQDESQFLQSFTTYGNWTGGSVLDLDLSPTYATDVTAVALGVIGGNATVHFSTGGGAWDANLQPVAVTNTTNTTLGQIALPSDFSPTAAFAFVGVNGTVALNVAPFAVLNAGVYRVTGSTTVGVAPTQLNTTAANVVSVDEVGAFASANIIYGTSTGLSQYSNNSGQTWNAPSSSVPNAKLTANLNTMVLLKSDYTTSLTAYALQVAGAVNDESGFLVSTDSGKDWVGVGLLNSTIADFNMNQLAIASNGDMFMITSATGGNHSLWRYTAATGNWDRVFANIAQANLSKIAVSPNYVTDKGVFFVDNNGIVNYSTNNGMTFSKQTVAAATAGNFTAYQVIDLNTFVVATPAGIMRTTNNGFIWTTVSTSVVNMFARSSDGTTMAAYDPATGAVIKSTDLGATWSAESTTAAQLMLGVTALTFQSGSNTVLWATTAAGLFSIDLSAATVTWSVNAASAVGSVNALDSAVFTNGVAVASGTAPTGNSITYALNGVTGNVARDLSGTPNVSGNINQGTLFTGASAMFIQPAAGANKLTVISGNAIFTYTDRLAAAVAGVTATGTTGANPTSTAVVSWTALTGAYSYSVAIVTGSTAVTDPYSNAFAAASVIGTTTTLTGLATNTTYTVSVWAVATSATGNAAIPSFAGTKTFSTQPAEVTTPTNLAPAAGATGIAITPGLQWGAVPGATSYTVEISTVNTFATLVGTKQTTTIPAFAWTTPALAYNTTYYWRVVAITATGSSDPVIGVFTTMAAPTTPPAGGGGNPGVTVTSTGMTITNASTETPGYVWAIIGIGALLVIVVIVLIVRTRRVA